MRTAYAGLAVLAALVLCSVAFVQLRGAFAQDPQLRRAMAGDQLLVFDGADPKSRQLVIVDPRSRIMSVYHVDAETGHISLRSVRNIHWDLQLDEFNGTIPSPKEIRSLLQP